MIAKSNSQSTIVRLESCFLRSVIAILAFTCVAKIMSSFGHASALHITNDVLPLTNRQVMQAAAGFEAMVLIALAFASQRTVRLVAVLWACLVFAAYRIAADVLTGGEKLCPCMGSVTQKLHITAQTADTIMTSLLYYMFVGSALFLLLAIRSTLGSAKKCSPRE